MPFSMMVVETRTLDFRPMKSIILFSRSRLGICPWMVTTLRLGDELFHEVGNLVDVLDSVMDVVDLTAAVEFLADG